MWIFESLYLWLCTLSSLIMLVSTSPLKTTSPTTIASIPLISTYNPNSLNLEKRQKKKNPFKNCDRVDVGRHNCKLMLEACFMFYEQFDPNEPLQRGAYYKKNCKRDVCSQTKGDCYYHKCVWC